jgi:hypothetical protein
MTTIKDDMKLQGNVDFNVSLDDAHGAGAIGTAFAPRHFRKTMDDHIITTIHVDLTGLKVKGDAQNDVIGLGAGGAAYLAQYTSALWGIIYKVEAICLEAPAGTNTTTDIDIALNSSSLEYDGAAGTAELNFGGMAVACIYTVTTPGSLTDDDYIYLVEGDTAATAGTYTAGQFIFRFYGHAALS